MNWLDGLIAQLLENDQALFLSNSGLVSFISKTKCEPFLESKCRAG